MKASSPASRKRPRRNEEDVPAPPPNENQLLTTPRRPSSKAKARAKAPKVSHNHPSPCSHHHHPLNGMVLAVSTLSRRPIQNGEHPRPHDGGGSSSDAAAAASSYNDVVGLCVTLGAEVTNQICKRVNVLVCTPSAFDGSTQRVRKAMRKSKPVVSVAWIEACRGEMARVDYEPYRLDGGAGPAAEAAIRKLRRSWDERERTGSPDSKRDVVAPDAGWTEPVDLG
jgi:hypothetical protein